MSLSLILQNILITRNRQHCLLNSPFQKYINIKWKQCFFIKGKSHNSHAVFSRGASSVQQGGKKVTLFKRLCHKGRKLLWVLSKAASLMYFKAWINDHYVQEGYSSPSHIQSPKEVWRSGEQDTVWGERDMPVFKKSLCTHIWLSLKSDRRDEVSTQYLLVIRMDFCVLTSPTLSGVFRPNRTLWWKHRSTHCF